MPVNDPGNEDHQQWRSVIKMKYLLVKWMRSKSEYPCLIYSELDDARWETRKVEIFPDGHIGYANELERSGSTRLGEAPIPALEEIAQDPQFQASELNPEDFDRVWLEACTGSS
jgi:hypothetical protein